MGGTALSTGHWREKGAAGKIIHRGVVAGAARGTMTQPSCWGRCCRCCQTPPASGGGDTGSSSVMLSLLQQRPAEPDNKFTSQLLSVLSALCHLLFQTKTHCTTPQLTPCCSVFSLLFAQSVLLLFLFLLSIDLSLIHI